MRVVDSREGVDGRSVRRRRECESCEFRFTTFERIEESLPMVVKKGGQRESFDRYKVLSGMKKACEKRPVSVLDLEEAVKQIETILLESGEKEISSEIIGSEVSDHLKRLDQVAYVRFASVYKEFSDVQEFLDTLNQLSNPTYALEKKDNAQLEINDLPSNVRPLTKNPRSTRSGQQLTLLEK
jgi:transcriptional repressor NrdR